MLRLWSTQTTVQHSSHFVAIEIGPLLLLVPCILGDSILIVFVSLPLAVHMPSADHTATPESEYVRGGEVEIPNFKPEPPSLSKRRFSQTTLF